LTPEPVATGVVVEPTLAGPAAGAPKSLALKWASSQPAREVNPSPAYEPPANRGKEIIRESKLKVLQRQYEQTLNETIQLEKNALSAGFEERAKMETQAQAMREFLSRLEAELQSLGEFPAASKAKTRGGNSLNPAGNRNRSSNLEARANGLMAKAREGLIDVLAAKEELAFVVANIGSKHGVKVGMPFRVVRNGEEVGTVRIVDVRERVSGAVIEDIKSDKKPIRTQDRLKADVARSKSIPTQTHLNTNL
jgi:hypothetical protein